MHAKIIQALNWVGREYDLMCSVEERGGMREPLVSFLCFYFVELLWSDLINQPSGTEKRVLCVGSPFSRVMIEMTWHLQVVSSSLAGFVTLLHQLKPLVVFFRGRIYPANSRHKESCHLRRLLSFRVSHRQLSSPFLQFGGKLCFRFLLRLILVSPAACRCRNSLIWKCRQSQAAKTKQGCERSNTYERAWLDVNSLIDLIW